MLIKSFSALVNMQSVTKVKKSETVGVRFTIRELNDIQKLIDSGEYSNTSEVIRDAFRSFRRDRGLIKV